MTQFADDNFDRLHKACLLDLKKTGIVKSVSLTDNMVGPRYAAKIEDHFFNTIEIIFGLKSSKNILETDEIATYLGDSAYIVLLDGPVEELRLTASGYSSSSEMETLFGLPTSAKDKKDVSVIQDILIARGLKVSAMALSKLEKDI